MKKTIDIFAVLVLYKTKLKDSLTYVTLCKAIEDIDIKINMLVYDNSPEMDKDIMKSKKIKIEYIHDKTNPGLCKAYNEGLKIANSKNKKWLLLLDQDTHLTSEYFKKLDDAIFQSNNNSEIVCILPHAVSEKGIPISPSKVYVGGINRPLKKNLLGVISGKITGINSGNTLKVNFMKEIKGFSSEFPLDMLDHWYFLNIYKKNKKVFLLDTTIIHKLSIYESKKSVDISRLYNIMINENKFINLYLTTFDKIILKFRLIIRLFGNLLKSNYKEVNILLLKLIIGKK